MLGREDGQARTQLVLIERRKVTEWVSERVNRKIKAFSQHLIMRVPERTIE